MRTKFFNSGRTGGWMRVCSLVFAKDAAKADLWEGEGN